MRECSGMTDLEILYRIMETNQAIAHNTNLIAKSLEKIALDAEASRRRLKNIDRRLKGEDR